jgi:threonine dehydrogenase-like Zn-dependent dehydrogenase
VVEGVKALLFERSLARYGAAMVAGRLRPGAGARVGPLHLAEVDEPALPGPGWHRVRPRLAGICGSDLATLDGRSSRYFEPFVSFPFVPGHEVVGELDDGTRVVVAATLTCAARGIEPPCSACAVGFTNLCERTAFGGLAAGLQTGYCADTGGGWSTVLAAHGSQLHPVPDDMADEAAVMVEPAACAVRAARLVATEDVAVVGAGTLGLCTVAALRSRTVVVAAKHPQQRALARDLGARVVAPIELERAVRSATGSLLADSRLTGGVGTVVDCVGSQESLAQCLRIVAPGGTVVLVGMPGRLAVDLTPLWHREIRLVGAYAYTGDDVVAAFDLVRDAHLDRLVSALYPLDRYKEAIDHAAAAGARGAVKVAFDLRKEKRR